MRWPLDVRNQQVANLARFRESCCAEVLRMNPEGSPLSSTHPPVPRMCGTQTTACGRVRARPRLAAIAEGREHPKREDTETHPAPAARGDLPSPETALVPNEAYMLRSIIGELRVGTSPRPVTAPRLIIPKSHCAPQAGAVNGPNACGRVSSLTCRSAAPSATSAEPQRAP